MALLGRAPRRPDCRPAALDGRALRARPSVLGCIIAVVAVASGCAGAAPAPGEPAAFDEDGDVPMSGQARRAERPPEPAPAEAAPAPAPAAAPASVPDIPSERAGVIARADLVEVLDRGPGRFLVGIEIEATFEGKQFAGWEIVRFEPEDARVGAAPLGPGDVITAVNARPIERPRQLQAVWEDLRAADALVVEGRRAGRPFALRYDIGR